MSENWELTHLRDELLSLRAEMNARIDAILETVEVSIGEEEPKPPPQSITVSEPAVTQEEFGRFGG